MYCLRNAALSYGTGTIYCQAGIAPAKTANAIIQV
jgi:hypothetical protein